MSSPAYERAKKYTSGMKAKGFVRIQGWVPAAERGNAYRYLKRKQNKYLKQMEKE